MKQTGEGDVITGISVKDEMPWVFHPFAQYMIATKSQMIEICIWCKLWSSLRTRSGGVFQQIAKGLLNEHAIAFRSGCTEALFAEC